ncbi:MAG TPA: hypothetical protein VFH22_07240, partial [Rhodocyclaceae bacterium]|nr:hypothetical protein [Rhodocyclaceae bacterium]
MTNPAAHPTPAAPAELRRRIHEHLRCDEDQLLDELIAKARFTSAERERIGQRAAPLIEKVRTERTQTGGIDAFMNTYDLSSREGIVLMCLAEALLRIPDAETQDLLIKDKIGPA